MGINESEIAFLLSDYAGYSADRYASERPMRYVDVASFAIDVFPVTNNQYAQAIAAGVVLPPIMWETGASGDAPVVGMSWYEASAYAAWQNGRLPSEAEWEMAAGWDPIQRRKYRYPWGDDWRADLSLNAEGLLGDRIAGRDDWLGRFWRDGSALSLGAHLPDVGTISGDESPSGVRMMSGHVWEWTLPSNADTREAWVRGGSWIDDRNSARVTYRVATPKAMWKFGPSDIGFRCVYSAA